jgi:hypothetical protein
MKDRMAVRFHRYLQQINILFEQAEPFSGSKACENDVEIMEYERIDKREDMEETGVPDSTSEVAEVSSSSPPSSPASSTSTSLPSTDEEAAPSTELFRDYLIVLSASCPSPASLSPPGTPRAEPTREVVKSRSTSQTAETETEGEAIRDSRPLRSEENARTITANQNAQARRSPSGREHVDAGAARKPEEESKPVPLARPGSAAVRAVVVSSFILQLLTCA